MSDMAMSPRFVVAEQYLRVEAPEDSAFAGFWAEVRENLTNGERQQLLDRLQEIEETDEQRFQASHAVTRELDERMTAAAGNVSAQAIVAAEIDIFLEAWRRETESRKRLKWALVTPYIRAWNVATRDGEDAEYIDAPPPSVGGIAALEHVTEDMAIWLCSLVLAAYRLGKGVNRQLKKPNASPGPTPGPNIASAKARKTSSTRRRPKS